MVKANDQWKDKDLQAVIGNLLRIGVVIASVVILLGGLLYLWQYGLTKQQYHVFGGLSNSYHTFGAVVQQAIKGKSEAIIQLGILFLIATPVARVAFSILGFIREKDRLYIVLTLIVLAIIVASMLMGTKG